VIVVSEATHVVSFALVGPLVVELEMVKGNLLCIATQQVLVDPGDAIKQVLDSEVRVAHLKQGECDQVVLVLAEDLFELCRAGAGLAQEEEGLLDGLVAMGREEDVVEVPKERLDGPEDDGTRHDDTEEGHGTIQQGKKTKESARKKKWVTLSYLNERG